MLDQKFIRENPDVVRQSLIDRNDDPGRVDAFLDLDGKRRTVIQQVEELKCRKNEESKRIGELIKKKEDASGAKETVRKMSEEIDRLDSELKDIEAEYQAVLDMIPNVPHETTPTGRDASGNKLVAEHGKPSKPSFKMRDHLELGHINGLFDLERGAKIAGSAFPLFTGQGAKLERVLINYMLDLHVNEHGYKEVFPPVLVNRESMYGTGQVPKLEDDMYRLRDEDFFLIPTAEVPVTNMRAGEILAEEELPTCYTAYTLCFRREAGSYGKDTKGLVRVHQFDKVEMVKFTRPEDSMEELEKLVSDAEDVLKRFGLTYRVMELCTGDISFAAQKCYDIELWAPGSGRWLEVSSCSVFGDFQARRANIKYQPVDKALKPRYLHTLNGSGVALPRLVIAILETYQNADGSITVPEVIRGRMGTDSIGPVT